jgi:signal peptidase
VVIVDSVGASAIQEGDVITFRRGGEDTPTTHRVIEVVDREDGVAFRTKGDANEDPDAQLVTPSQVEGEVQTIGGHLFVIPYIGYVIQFMQTTTGFVALFVVPIALLIVSEVWNVIAASRRTESTESADSDEPDEDDESVPAASTNDGTPDETAEPASTDASETTETEDGQLTFSALELQLGLGVLTAFLAYSLWVVYAAVEIFQSGVIWAAGVAAAVGVAFMLFLGLYLSGRSGGSETERAENEAVTAADGGEHRQTESSEFDWNAESESDAETADDAEGGEADE